MKSFDVKAQKQPFLKLVLNNLVVAALTALIFYLSLVTTSMPLEPEKAESVGRAVALLEAKGFEREVYLLRWAATFRSGDNWLNLLTNKENAFAATNFPLGVITLYPDFFDETHDDTERAMVLLHEAQHLKGANEPEAYEFVWRNRRKLGWTHLSHGTTPTFVTVEQQTRENTPYIFTCPANLFSDCTENINTGRRASR